MGAAPLDGSSIGAGFDDGIRGRESSKIKTIAEKVWKTRFSPEVIALGLNLEPSST